MPDKVLAWPFPSSPHAWGTRTSGDSVYVFGIFEPEERRAKRLKRTMVVARYFTGAPQFHYEVINDPKEFTDELKAVAEGYKASYPASDKEHAAFMRLPLPRKRAGRMADLPQPHSAA